MAHGKAYDIDLPAAPQGERESCEAVWGKGTPPVNSNCILRI
jgi:hypothetical protein